MATYEQQFKAATNPDTGERLILAVDPDNADKGKWVPEAMMEQVKPWVHKVKTNQPATAFSQRVQNVVDKKTKAAEKWATEGFLDPQRADQREAASKMSGPEAFSVNAIRETMGFPRGVRNLVTDLAGMASGAVGADRAEDYLMHQSLRNAQDKIERDKQWEGFEDETFGAGLGKIMPYMLTGRMFEPAARATTGRALAKTGEVVKEGAQQTGGLMSRVIKAQAAGGSAKNPATKLAKELEEIIVDPLQKKMSNIKAQAPVQDEFREGFLQQVGTYGGVGAGEGMLSENLDTKSGTASSIIGGTLGRMVSPALSKAPNKNSQAVNELLDEMETKGFRTLPGLRTGQPEYQIHESNLRTDKKYSGYFKDVDNANDAVVTKMAGETIGLDAQTMRDLTPAKLKTHREGLKQEFDVLEDATVGKINKADLERLGTQVAELPSGSKKAQDLYNELYNLKHVTGRDPGTGQITPATFSGKDYKQLSTKIKQARDGAKINGRMEEASAYDNMLKELDNGMYKGVEKHGGTATANQWKDLRQRYALTELIEQHGMTPVGGIDANRLGKYFLEHDSKRLLEGSDGPIDDLHKIAKMNYIQKKQEGGGLGRDNIEDDFLSAGEGPRHLLSTPQSLMMPLRRRLPAALYTKGYPSETGLLGMNKDAKYWGSPAMGRAFEQSQQLHTDPMGNIENVGRRIGAYGLDKAFDAKEWLNEMLEQAAANRGAE